MKLLYVPLLFILLLLSGCDDENSSTVNINPNDDIVYELTFTSNWNAGNFATNFPASAHFSGLIGLTHNSQITIFKNSELASAGIISMAETGSKTTLSSEIVTHVSNNNADKVVNGNSIAIGSTSTSLLFSANTNFSLFSIVSMVAPSPDWFVGINSLQLYENGQWKDNLTLNLSVYDSGSDSADTFTAANAPQSPKVVISLLTTDSANTNFLAGVHRDNGTFIGTITLKIKQVL